MPPPLDCAGDADGIVTRVGDGDGGGVYDGDELGEEDVPGSGMEIYLPREEPELREVPLRVVPLLLPLEEPLPERLGGVYELRPEEEPREPLEPLLTSPLLRVRLPLSVEPTLVLALPSVLAPLRVTLSPRLPLELLPAGGVEYPEPLVPNDLPYPSSSLRDPPERRVPESRVRVVLPAPANTYPRG